MPVLSIDLEIWCSCGEGLCNQSDVSGTSITIEPCSKCLSRAEDGGYDNGHEIGYRQGVYDSGEE